MVKKGDPRVLRLVARFLRLVSGMKQEDFGRAARVDQSNLSDYEIGKVAPPEETLRRMADVARVPWPVVVHLRRFYVAALRLVDRAGILPPADPGSLEPTTFEVVLLAVTPYLVEPWAERPSADEEMREAEEIWTALQTFPPERRRRLIELSPQPEGNAALARRICEASARAVTGHRIEEARELADLARFTARRVPREVRRKGAAGL